MLGNQPKERIQHSEHGEIFQIKKVEITYNNNSVVSAVKLAWQQLNCKSELLLQ